MSPGANNWFREQSGVAGLDNFLQDLGFGLRMLARNPGFTAIIVLTLALGIGATTAIYSVVDNVLLNPLPVPEPNRVMEIFEHRGSGVSADVLAAVRANQSLSSDVVWFDYLALQTRTEGFTDMVRGEMVSPNFFSFWKVQPILGRTFAQDEAVPLDAKRLPERDSVIVLSYAWWKSRFAGDVGLIGKTIELGERRFTVIGVMPQDFHYPQGWRLSFWVPTEDPRPAFDGGTAAEFGLLVRLKSITSRTQAQATLDVLSQRLMQERNAVSPNSSEPSRSSPESLKLGLRPLAESLLAGYRGADDLPRTLYGLLGAIGFLLLIVCLNVANLTLARTERRQQELAIRSALGAGRARLARQLVTEGILLTCLGGVAGLTAAVGFMKLLLLLLPPNMPRLKGIGIDSHALFFELLVCAVIGAVFGLVSAWHSSRTRLNETLKQAAPGATPSRNRNHYRNALVVMEVGFSLVLLAGAGLMIGSVVRLLHVNLGFDPENLLYVNLWLPSKYSDSSGSPNARQSRNALFDRLSREFAALPDIKAVGIWGGYFGEEGGIKIEGRLDPLHVSSVGCGVEESDLLRAMRTPLRAGRYLDRSDIDDKSGAALINESMARLCWPGENALGRKFRLADPPDGSGSVYQVAGIVADARPVRYTQGVAATFYRPYHHGEFGGTTPPLLLVIRAGHDPRSSIPALLKALTTAEPEMNYPRIEVARQDLDDSTKVQRTYMFYLVGFAGIGLILAALGIYGVLAYSVACRTREIGIRLAIGGQRGNVLGMVMWEGTRLVVAGAVLGLVAAFWLLQVVRHLVFESVRTSGVEEGPISQLLKYQLFQAGSANSVVWSGAVLLLIAVALLACWLPARRATRVDPMEALRCE